MKYISSIVLLLIFTTGIFAQTTAPKFNDAIEYNDYIVNQQAAVGVAINEYMAEVNDSLSTKESCNKQRLLSLAKVKECRDKVKAMPAWQGDKSLRDTSAMLFDFYVRTFDGSYSKMLDLIFADPFTEETKVAIDALIAELTAEEARYDGWFSNCQLRFAVKNGFTLTE
jgi:hypothetical protein